MSTPLDALTPFSDAGHAPRSSARPISSAGANSDAEGFQEDEIADARVTGRRANGPRTDIPKEIDPTGEVLLDRFQDFLERYASPWAL
jgi:DNA replication licensing factor MCM6